MGHQGWIKDCELINKLLFLIVLGDCFTINLLDFFFCSFVEGLAELVVQTGEDIARLFEQGNRVRKLASADKNSGGAR